MPQTKRARQPEKAANGGASNKKPKRSKLQGRVGVHSVMGRRSYQEDGTPYPIRRMSLTECCDQWCRSVRPYQLLETTICTILGCSMDMVVHAAQSLLQRVCPKSSPPIYLVGLLLLWHW